MRVGVVGDAAALEQPAGLLEVGRGDVDRPALERLAEAVAQVAVLARRDRRAGRRGDAPQGGDVLGRDRVLEPQQAERLELVREPLRVGDLVAPVAVEGDVDLGPDGVDHRGGELDHRAHLGAAERARRGVLHVLGRDVEVELQRAEAELGDDLAGALRVQLGGEELVRRRGRVGAAVLGRADRAGLDRLGRLLGPARGAGDHRRVHRLERLARVAVGVHAHGVTKATTEEAVDRHAVGLADEVPQRGLHPRDRVVDDAGRRAGARRAPAQLAPQAVDVARILADQQRREVAHDAGQARRGVALAEPGEPVGVGVDRGRRSSRSCPRRRRCGAR